MHVLAFAASNSKKSINREFATYAANLLSDAEIEILDIHDYELPIFSNEREEELGQPKLARKFFNKIGNADAIIISFAEHNGSYTAAYKNLFDWTSRINKNVFQHKPMVLLSTSPGPGGAANVLESAAKSAPYFGGDVKAKVSLPSFHDNFDVSTKELNNKEINKLLLVAVNLLRA